MIISSSKTVKEASRKLKLLKKSVDKPENIEIFATGNWMTAECLPVIASGTGFKVVELKAKYMTAILDGEKVDLMESIFEQDKVSKFTSINIHYLD